MQKILLTGVRGQVGSALVPHFSDVELFALSSDQLDLTKQDDIRRVVSEVKPNLIINPAAYTAVDRAETEAELAYAINETASRVLAEEAAKCGAAMIHFSTDYVYDGQKKSPYIETDVVNPVSVYGKSKLAGEQAIQNVGLPHLILRTSWVYDAYGKNFLNTILRLAKERERLTIVGDQKGSPTSSKSIAGGVKEVLQQWSIADEQQSGIYHLTNADSTTWHGFACEIVETYLAQHGEDSLKAAVSDIMAITTAEYPTPAARPASSILDNTKLAKVFGVELPTWQAALQSVMQEIASAH